MIIPTRLDFKYVFAPVANAIIIGITITFFIFEITGALPYSVFNEMVLRDMNPMGLIGNLLLHASWLHLIGNMLVLWVFGNAVNSVVGNKWYPVIYVGLGIAASMAHLALSDGSAVGASGAINGIVGMSLVLFPGVPLKILLFVWLAPIRLSPRSFWTILMWLVFDFIGVAAGGDHIAHWAHLGGFFAGVGLGFLLLRFQKVASYDSSIVDLWNRRKRKLNSPVKYEFDKRNDYRENRISDKDDTQLDYLVKAYEKGIPLDPQSQPDRVDNPESVKSYENKGTIPTRENSSAGPALNVPVVPKLRLLRAHRNQKDLSIYFVNEGDEIKNVGISSPQITSIEYYPKEMLKKKDTGWAAMRCDAGDVPHNPSIILTYSDNGTSSSKEYSLDEENNKMTEANK
ncbi:MAG TPA: rhomboid family intramembrane serine protease [Candidatus Acidoferrales bacterium]|nr:rhomboid family intramembrane serine protease [Candidatus Acidoferrales bacterium]